MFGNALALAALLAAASLTAAGPSRAQAPTVFQATLGENAKGAEVSTEQMQEILRDRSAIVLDTRTRAE
ncbi:MAG: hypothetical protein ABW198_08390, partial [Pseudorhodoplanes sp.]